MLTTVIRASLLIGFSAALAQLAVAEPNTNVMHGCSVAQLKQSWCGDCLKKNYGKNDYNTYFCKCDSGGTNWCCHDNGNACQMFSTAPKTPLQPVPPSAGTLQPPSGSGVKPPVGRPPASGTIGH
jgi:hypothetical protein